MQTSDGTTEGTARDISLQSMTATESLAGHTADGDEGHAHLPPPSIWPIASAFGFVLIGFGLVTSWYFWVAGLIITGYGIVSWIQELRHEPH